MVSESECESGTCGTSPGTVYSILFGWFNKQKKKKNVNSKFLLFFVLNKDTESKTLYQQFILKGYFHNLHIKGANAFLCGYTGRIICNIAFIR